MRELEHVIERAVVLSSGEAIQPEDLALPVLTDSPPWAGPACYQTRLAVAELEALGQALQEHGGDKRATARDLGIALSTLYTKLKKSQPSPAFLPVAPILAGDPSVRPFSESESFLGIRKNPRFEMAPALGGSVPPPA